MILSSSVNAGLMHDFQELPKQGYKVLIIIADGVVLCAMQTNLSIIGVIRSFSLSDEHGDLVVTYVYMTSCGRATGGAADQFAGLFASLFSVFTMVIFLWKET